jgi:hypothetical protein
MAVTANSSISAKTKSIGAETKRPFKQPKLIRYGALAKITMESPGAEGVSTSMSGGMWGFGNAK